MQLVKEWSKFLESVLDNDDAPRHVTSFSFYNRYEVNVAASVFDETCPVLRNTPPARSGQIRAGTAFSYHMDQTDVIYRALKAPNMLSRSI